MLNITFTFQTPEEAFISMNSFHNALKGFKPYVDNEIGICPLKLDDNQNNGNCFVLSIGEDNGYYSDIVADDMRHQIPNINQIDNNDIIQGSYDAAIRKMLGSSKYSRGIYINGSGYLLDRTCNMGACILHIFPDIINNMDSKVYDQIMKWFPVMQLEHQRLSRNDLTALSKDYLINSKSFSYFQNDKQTWIQDNSNGLNDQALSSLPLQTLIHPFPIISYDNDFYNEVEILRNAERVFLSKLHNFCSLI